MEEVELAYLSIVELMDQDEAELPYEEVYVELTHQYEIEQQKFQLTYIKQKDCPKVQQKGQVPLKTQ